VLVAVLGGGLPVGALAAVVVVLVVTRRRYRRPMTTMTASLAGGESSCGIAALADADCDVMNNRRAKARSSKFTDYAAVTPCRSVRYDTIRDAILTCARKPTRVRLVYRTETTTKNCKTEKTKK